LICCSHWVSGARSAAANSEMTVDQFIPEASPLIAKSGELVVEVLPLLKLGGVPVESKVDNRFEPLVELEIELDMVLNFHSKNFHINRLRSINRTAIKVPISTAKSRTAFSRRPRM
jgi:hypothetical protein